KGRHDQFSQDISIQFFQLVSNLWTNARSKMNTAPANSTSTPVIKAHVGKFNEAMAGIPTIPITATIQAPKNFIPQNPVNQFPFALSNKYSAPHFEHK